jgi:hypothetical protein
MYAPNDKLTFGFFSKAIARAKPEYTVDMFFHNMDQSGEYFGDLVERKCSFIYFFKAQYDPDTELLDGVTFTFGDEEA